MALHSNKVALEEHFSAPGLEPSIDDVAFFDPEILREIEISLPEISEQRLQATDKAGISVAALSQTAPGVQSIPDTKLAVEMAERANNFLEHVLIWCQIVFAGLLVLPCKM